MHFYWSRIPQNIDAVAPSVAARTQPLTDLYAQWFGVRELLVHHRNPYGDDVTRELQLAYYGKELDRSVADQPAHQQRFAYPLYVALLLAPTVGMQFHTVQIIFWWLLVAITASSAPLWSHTLGLKLSPVGFALALVVTFTCMPVMQGLGLLQFGLLVAGLLSGAAAATVSGHLFLAGILLAFATIKPQMSILAIVWFGLWVFGDWRTRRSLVWGFTATLAVLVLASELLLPGWFMRFLIALVEYQKHTRATSLLGVYLPVPLERLLAAAASLMVARYAWHARQQAATSPFFALALASALSLTLLVVPTVVPLFNEVLLIPVVLLTIRYWTELQRRNRLSRFATSVLCAIGFLPWLFALAVTTGFLMQPFREFLRIWFAPLNSSLALPFAAFGLLILLMRELPPDAGSVSFAPASRRGLL